MVPKPMREMMASPRVTVPARLAWSSFLFSRWEVITSSPLEETDPGGLIWYIRGFRGRNWQQAAGRCQTKSPCCRDPLPSQVSMPIAQASSWHAPPRPLVDLQATDQVTLESKAPLQLGGATGEVAGDAASHEVALLTDALGAAHLGGVLVLGRRTFPPASDLGGEQRNDGVDVTTSVSIEVTGDDESLRD